MRVHALGVSNGNGNRFGLTADMSRQHARAVQIRRLLLIIALLGVTFGGKPVLQTVAWVGMLYSYSAEQSFSLALSDTFSGERPCPLCEAIADQRTPQEQLNRRLDKLRVECVVDPAADILQALDAPPACTGRIAVQILEPLDSWRVQPACSAATGVTPFYARSDVLFFGMTFCRSYFLKQLR